MKAVMVRVTFDPIYYIMEIGDGDSMDDAGVAFETAVRNGSDLELLTTEGGRQMVDITTSIATRAVGVARFDYL